MTSGFDAIAFDALRRGRFGRPLRALRTTGSTNADALAWAAEGAPEGAVVVAEHQTAGRGRRGRSWSSRPGLSLLFSVVLRPQLELDRLGLVTTAFGVAVAEAADAEALGLGIKWPNDIVAGGRKLAGILVESRVSGRIADVAVGGVGLNVGWADAELPEEVSASAVTLAEVRRRAAALSTVLGREVTIRLGTGETVSGRALDLDDAGSLVVETARGVQTVDSGEVERLRPAVE
jgi:BirA family transcriptional regulator, biotin operon repressor / biotin---[acetyl-CoA-carboxylase] ligase